MNDSTTGFFTRLRQRKLVQWALAYIAAAFALIQVLDVVVQRFGWPEGAEKLIILALALGFVVVLVLAWYHGEKGRQWVSGPELLLITLVLAVGGVVIWRFVGHGAPETAGSAAEAVVRHESSAAVAASTRGVVTASSRSPDAAQRNPGQPALKSSPAAIPAKSIAVLPFENLSTDKGNAYFADGMQDLILTKLADIGDLKVIARTSTEKYQSHPDDLKSIGRQLGVATILEGSVQKAGNQVLINVQLIDANTNAHIWADSYTRTLDNIFGVEGEVADKVAKALNAKLTGDETARVARAPTQNAAALDAYLRGEYYVNFAIARSAQKADFVRAVQSYTEAVNNDPRFALAWAGLGRAQVFLHEITYDNPQLSTRLAAGAKTSIERALALQPDLPQAYVAQGVYDIWIHGGGEAALRAFTEAHRLQPQYAAAVMRMGDVLYVQGKYERAARAARELSKLDPNNPPVLLAQVEWAMHHRTEAGESFQRALALAPASWVVIDTLARWYAYNGDLQRMGALLDTASASTKSDPKFAGTLGLYLLYRRDWPAARKLYADVGEPGNLFQARYPVELARGDIEWYAGDRATARKQYLRAAVLVEHMMTVQPHSPRWHGELGWVYARLGRDREALQQGQMAVQSHNPWHNTNRLSKPGSLWLARIQAQVGKAGEAVAALDTLLAAPTGLAISVPLLKLDPTWDPIRKDPRFQALLKRYGDTVAANDQSASGSTTLTKGKR